MTTAKSAIMLLTVLTTAQKAELIAVMPVPAVAGLIVVVIVVVAVVVLVVVMVEIVMVGRVMVGPMGAAKFAPINIVAKKR